MHTLHFFRSVHLLGELVKFRLQRIKLFQLLSRQFARLLLCSGQGLNFLVNFRSLAAEFFDQIHVAFLFISDIKKAAIWPPG